MYKFTRLASNELMLPVDTHALPYLVESQTRLCKFVKLGSHLIFHTLLFRGFLKAHCFHVLGRLLLQAAKVWTFNVWVFNVHNLFRGCLLILFCSVKNHPSHLLVLFEFYMLY